VGRPLKVGVQLPEVEYVASWTDHREMARVAEDVGLDSIWLGDHLLYRDQRGSLGPWECWSMLAGLAAVTSRIELGPLVASTSFHEPAMLAKKAATVDEISGGRLVLGLGAGWNEVEYRAFGFPFDHRVSRFEEAFTIIRTLLREGRIDFDGRFYQLRDCELLPRGPRAEGPPLMVGSTGERMLRITMPHVQRWNAWYTAFDNRADRIPELAEKVDAACREVGRDPAEVRRTVAVFVRMSGGGGKRPSAYAEWEKVEPLGGEPETFAEGLRAFARAGIQEVQLVMDPITPASIEELGPGLQLLDRD
jgi:alkanesulfonate monooxygenase SsuD/methylene tetrahydromethanopterin reductase-like flavin-dependent oxidoreductase (luciferase family)